MRSAWGAGGMAVGLTALVGATTISAGEAPRKIARAGRVYVDLPPSIEASARYLLYLHGRIVELQGRHAVSPQHGRYEFDGILDALAERGFVVIAEVRPRNTGLDYAKKVAGQVRRLTAAGVAAEHITVVGFSKGGALVLATSAELAEPAVSFVVLAGCGAPGGSPLARQEQDDYLPRMKGRMLSVYDESDREAGSCRETFARASGGLETKEVALRGGLGHGLFFAPRKEWLDLVSDWAKGP